MGIKRKYYNVWSNSHKLTKLLEEEIGSKRFSELRKSRDVQVVLEALQDSRSVYVDEEIEVKTTLLSRLLLPLFIVMVYFLYLVVGSICWLIKGKNNIWIKDSKARKFMVKWNNWGGYNIL